MPHRPSLPHLPFRRLRRCRRTRPDRPGRHRGGRGRGRRIAALRGICGGEIIALPRIDLDGRASLSVEPGPAGTALRGADVLRAALADALASEVLARFLAGGLDMDQPARLQRSLSALRRLEREFCDIAVSGVLADLLRETPVLHGPGAPTQTVLFRLFERLCDYLGVDPDPAMVRDRLFAASLALTPSDWAQTPWDVEALGLSWGPDSHWHPQAVRLATRALANRQPSVPTCGRLRTGAMPLPGSSIPV